MDMTDMTRAAVSRRHFLQLAGAGMLALTGTALAGCGNSTSDDEYGFYVCDMDLDEDETAQFIGGRFQNCPYYRPGDEYTIVRKQI